jgi:CGNR zinc finger protein/putative stress-induced transcription regulator
MIIALLPRGRHRRSSYTGVRVGATGIVDTLVSPREALLNALLLRDYVNTCDIQCGMEEFGAPAELGAWLAEHGLIPPGTRADETSLEAALALREGLRAAMLSHQEPGGVGGRAVSDLADGGVGGRVDGGVDDDLDRLLAGLPLRLSLAGPELVPVHDGVRGGLARVAAAVMACAADGSWPRLKVCRVTDCRWAFLDTSKNRSRTWCSMRMCGNRTKTRAYRARQRVRGRLE